MANIDTEFFGLERSVRQNTSQIKWVTWIGLGVNIVLPAFNQLADIGASQKVRDLIQKIVMETGGVKTVHAMRTRFVGAGMLVDLHIMVDPTMTVFAGHEISEQVKDRLRSLGPDVLDVVVHLEPFSEENPVCPP